MKNLIFLATSACALLIPREEVRTIPTVDGWRFKIDGVTKYWAGTNAYWLPFLTNNADVDLVLDHMSAAELRIVRIWGFNDVKSIPQNGEYPLQSSYLILTILRLCLVPSFPSGFSTRN